MNNLSLLVSDNHLSGEIKLQKENGSINVIESNISKIISNKLNTEKHFNNYQEIINSINDVIASMCFTSRFIDLDMFTNKKYDNNILSRYIYGIQNMYNIPGGIVLYHESNELLFCCTNIQFMLTNNIISFKYTDIDISKIYKVKRTDGSIQDTVLIQNGGLILDETQKKIKLINTFSSNKDEKLNPIFSGGLQKAVSLDNFMETNNLSSIKINIPYISNEIKKDYEKHYCDLIDYYNKELDKFNDKLKEYNVTNIENTINILL